MLYSRFLYQSVKYTTDILMNTNKEITIIKTHQTYRAATIFYKFKTLELVYKFPAMKLVRLSCGHDKIPQVIFNHQR